MSCEVLSRPVVSKPQQHARATLLTRSPPNPQSLRTFRIAVLFSAVIILNLIDLVFTLFAHHIGMLDEVNPFARGFLQLGLTNSLIAFKLLMLSSGLILLWRLRLSRWVPPACWILVIAYVGLSIIWYLWVRDVNFTYETQATAMSPHIRVVSR